ncbi:molybdopterin oxidoreductase family protein [Granulosicoccus antarcticus]|uniref:Dimethyl sulfoxide reductase chain YnfE n=1 Tax=Granulosicoccus antarcticus IMCC3135 TaxID=1192854 RepID=A0A2Z2NWL0_9GAMM|nr:molybdopterin oxidoreductase family protein [Granulosicoccus antarcticus]ASJ75623.1 Putative dimethyl sulfoxide reductase chain YnfE [Granulosicoccus antarcticus IMCC3135]
MTTRMRSVCPHDCPSVCALDVEVVSQSTIGRIYGAKDHSYTQGVICAKVSRYAERVHHPDRLMKPLRRKGSKSSSAGFEAISWDDALDTICERFERIRKNSGAEAIWPFHYAGTMGLVQRDGLDRFRHAYGTSRQHSTYCVSVADAGFKAGAGVKSGSDARLMHQSDLIVVWGGNPVSTQVNVMHHVSQAKRLNGAKFVVVDPYRTKTADKADLHLMLKPGTDGALACAVMHVLFEEGLADQAYMAAYTAKADDLRQHLATRTPAWAAEITGLPVEQIVEFARLYGRTKKSFLRIGYGFSRSRNGAVNLHAVTCLPAVSGAWQYEGGGALYGNSSIYKLDRTKIQGLDIVPDTRAIDQSRIGRVLTGNAADLQGGPAIEALFIQNTNPAVVAPETRLVLQGLARDDLFSVVHEQFMTETAEYADIVLPATMFLEHDDIYTASGHTHLQIGQKLIDAPGECRSNHALMQALAERLGLSHAGFQLSERELINDMLLSSGLPDFDAVLASGGLDCAHASFRDANFLNGFGTPDKRFHFSPDWSSVGNNTEGMPAFPDHWAVIDSATEACPLRLVAAPARQFLNSSFTETPSSRRMEKKPLARLHPDDMACYGIEDGALVTLGNDQGEVSLEAMAFDGVQPGTVVVESLWPNRYFAGGLGINTLVSSEPAQPDGGAVFHDTAVWARPGS